MVALTQALQGISNSEAKFNAAANQIARALLAALNQGGPTDQVDLSTSVVALLQSCNSFGANVKVLRTADEMTRTLLNAVG